MEFNDLCDRCMRSGVEVHRTDENGSTVCVECDAEEDEAESESSTPRLPQSLEFENDEDGWTGPFGQSLNQFENWLIRDPNTDGNDIVAIVPKTGDEQYDNDVTYPLVRLLAAAPELLAMLRAMVKEFGHSNNKFNVKKDFSKLVALRYAEDAIAKATVLSDS